MFPSNNSPEEVLRRLEWTVLRRLDGLLQGDYRTLFRGFGLDLAKLREYQFHDDVRYIDWNVTARLQTPYVRQFNEDREITVWFLLDLSPSVDFGSHNKTKLEMLIDFVGLIALLLQRNGNRIGAMCYTDKVIAVVPPRGGRLQGLHLLDVVKKQPRTSRIGETDLGELLRSALNSIKRRSVIFLISDFLSKPEWEVPIGHLAIKHEIVAVRIVDPLETKLPDLGMITITDAETGEHLMVDTHDPGFRQRFEESARQREDAIRSAFVDAGVDALALSTEDDLVEAVVRYVGLRKQRSLLAAGSSPRRMK